jgi:predicted ATPase
MTESSARRAAGGLLRGRESELAVLGECLSGVARGEAGMLLVEGPAGIGKSSLLAEARVMAGRMGVKSAEVV